MLGALIMIAILIFATHPVASIVLLIIASTGEY